MIKIVTEEFKALLCPFDFFGVTMQVLRPKRTELREDNMSEVCVHIPEVTGGSMTFLKQALKKPE